MSQDNADFDTWAQENDATITSKRLNGAWHVELTFRRVRSYTDRVEYAEHWTVRRSDQNHASAIALAFEAARTSRQEHQRRAFEQRGVPSRLPSSGI